MRVVIILICSFMLLLTGVSGCVSWSASNKYPPIGEFIDADGVRLHVVDIGPKASELPPLLLIHGASVNLRDMKLALGGALSADRRVVIIDRPGRGYSERAAGGYRLDSQAQTIKAAVDALDLKDPVVVGQSLGGAVALAYALRYQDDMSGLVLLAAVSHEWPGGIAWYNSASQWPVAGTLLRRLVVPLYGQLSAEKGIIGSFAPNAPPENYYAKSGLALLFRAADFEANAADIAHLKAQIILQQNRYSELTLPVAIVTGTDDTTVSPQIHSKHLARDIKQAKLTLLPDTGHALHHAETAKIIDIINEISLAQTNE